MKNLLPLLCSIFMLPLFSQDMKEERIDSLIYQLYTQDQYNGSLRVLKGDSIAFGNSYGYANLEKKEKNSTETAFDIASISKTFTAMAVAILVERGKINYEDKLSKYIPELAFYKGIKISNVLNHTSGIPRLNVFADEIDSTTAFTNDHLLRSLAENKFEKEFKVNTKHQYSNTNYVLLAIIIERVAKQSLSSFLTENIFTPLGMKNTYILNSQEGKNHKGKRATPYAFQKNSLDRVNVNRTPKGDFNKKFGNLTGDGGIYSTIEDLSKWIQAIKNHQLIKRSTFSNIIQIRKTKEGKNIPYGLGWQLKIEEEQVTLVYHTGRIPGFLSLLAISLDEGYDYLSLQNFDYGANPMRNVREILDDEPLSPKFQKQIILSERYLDRFVGSYENDKGEIQIITRIDDHLVYNVEDEESQNINWDLKMAPFAKNEFFLKSIAGSINGKVSFIEEDGNMKLEMYQDGTKIDNGIRLKSN